MNPNPRNLLRAVGRASLLAVLPLVLAGCASSTVRERTLAANAKGEYSLTTMAISPPQSDDWRLVRQDKEFSSLWLYHADDEAVLAAIWQPIFPHTAKPDPAEIAREFFRKHVVEDIELSPEITVESVEEGGSETVGASAYQMWRMRFTSQEMLGRKEKKTLRCLAFVRAASPKPDLFVYVLAVPEKGHAHWEDHERTLRELVAAVRYLDYMPEQVALARQAIAEDEFLKAIEEESKHRDIENLRQERASAITEAESATRLVPRAPQPWAGLARIAEYNEEGFRYGDGFDAARVEECYRRAIEKRTSYILARQGLAKLYEVQGRNDAAERELKSLIQAEPSNGESHYLLGRFYQRLGRETEALDCFRESLRFWRGAQVTRNELRKEVKSLEKKLGSTER